MKSGNNADHWSFAHTSFGMSPGAASVVEARDRHNQTFFEEALQKSPNGWLYHHSSFIQNLQNSSTTYLGHVTFRLKEISKSQTVLASGGCLVGSVYCFPLTRQHQSHFRIHNLGEYIYKQETLGRTTEKPDLLLFEIERKQSSKNAFGINYLRLGEIHYRLFSELEHLLSPHERSALTHTVESRISRALPFLRTCYDTQVTDTKNGRRVFFEQLREAIAHLPILGYILFESIAEYLMLYTDSRAARQCAEQGEFYNVAYKELIYALRPGYRQNFHLTDFNIPLADICREIRRIGCITNFEEEHFWTYVAKKVVYHIKASLFSSDPGTNAKSPLTPLIGHLIHRELRSFGRYPDFYLYYDQLKAIQAWNYWNRMDITIPFNGVFPKGEAGINPANPDLNIRIFRCDVHEAKDGLIAIPAEEISARLVPRLVDPKFTLLRNKPTTLSLQRHAYDHHQLAPHSVLANLPALAI
jgi:hypothetical protein